MRSGLLFSVSIAIFILFLNGPTKVFAQNVLGIRINFIEQDTRELEKMKRAGVTTRTLMGRLVLSKDKEAPPAKIEEMIFNKKGLLIKKNQYNNLRVESRTEFKYNDKGALIKRTVFNEANSVVESETRKVDKNGKTIESNFEDLVKGKIKKDRNVFVYDKKGLLIEIRNFQEGKNTMARKEMYEYKDGLLIAKKRYTVEGYFLGSDTYEYDSLKRKIKESILNITYKLKKDSANSNGELQAFQDNAEYLFKYDEKGNIIEIKAPEYRQEFTFNENGDFVKDIVYNKAGKKQNDNGFFYNENGLLKQVIRYQPDGSPGIYLDYSYEIKK